MPRRPTIPLLLVLAAVAGCVAPLPSGSPGASPGGTPASAGPSASAASASAEPSPSGPTPTDPSPNPGPDRVRLERVVDGLASPIGISHAGDGSGRLFINEQAGVVRVVEADGTLRSAPFLDIGGRVLGSGERGLLGLAFHPGFATNRRLFVHYSRAGDGATVLAELTAAADGQSADPASERVLLTVDQPYANHNGGQLSFGPDGYLYLGLGDGGSGGDPHGNGQNLRTMLGKILRLDVDSPPAEGKQYAIPTDNPYAADGASPGAGLPEIWAFGLRNPWRFSFDQASGDLYIGDVGQGDYEEIDRQPRDSTGGLNYGWNAMEGRHCYLAGCDPSGLVQPIAEYDHGLGCSVIGGFVYRGTAQAGLVGVYLFGDLCSGRLFSVPAGEGPFTPKEVLQSPLRITSFGEDEAGEVYLVATDGGLYRVLVDE